MEAGDEDGLAKDVAVHRVDDGRPRGGGFLRRALWHVDLRVQRVELERVVVIGPWRRAACFRGGRGAVEWRCRRPAPSSPLTRGRGLILTGLPRKVRNRNHGPDGPHE